MKKVTRKQLGKYKQKQYELVPYAYDLDDPRKIKAAQILAMSGYKKDTRHHFGAVTRASQEAGVNRNTIYYWLGQEDFLMAIEEFRQVICVEAVQNLRDMSKQSPQAAIFLVETLAPEIYSRQHKKFEYEKELLQLRAKLGLPDQDLAPPSITIVAQTIESKDYERNKLE